MSELLRAAFSKADERLDAFASTLTGMVIQVDKMLAPNEVRLLVGEEMYERIKKAALRKGTSNV